MTAMSSTEGTLPPLVLHARLTANEITKGLRLMWRRRTLVITSMAFLAVVYVALSLLVGGGHLVRPVLTLTLPAMGAVAVASTAALQGSGGVAEEINAGTLEQLQLSQTPPTLQALGRLGALAAEGVTTAAVLGIAFSLGLGLHYHPSSAAVIPAVLTVADALGYGLVITALTIRVTSIGAITHVLNMALQFFGGMIAPVTVFPPALETFTHFVPTALGVQALNTTLAGRPLSATWENGTLPWLLIHVAVSLTLGFTLYAVSIRRARREGGLSPR
jgi:ABC-2 type transport system permease protein